MKTTCVFLAAGVCSRYGGAIKALVPVGIYNESMIEHSLKEALHAGFDDFVIVVSLASQDPIYSVIGDSFMDIPVSYSVQRTPTYRTRPYGWAHGLLSVKGLFSGAFCVVSTDDLIGVDVFRQLKEQLCSDQPHCVVGYQLKNVLPSQGTVNRAFLTHDNYVLTHIQEHFSISCDDIGGNYTGEENCAMLLYGLHTDFLSYLEQAFETFLSEHPDDPHKELLFQDVLVRFISSHKDSPFTVLTTDATPLGITNPGDEEFVREALRIKK